MGKKKGKKKAKQAPAAAAKAPAKAKATVDTQKLPNREAEMLNQIKNLCEKKQYKKALKNADQILKKYPENGETLAMKGLSLNCLGKKDEAEKLVKIGLMKNMQSPVCWHVLGLLHRANHDYNQAIKCYNRSIERDSDNLQTLKDLSLLQIQQRILTGPHSFSATRRKILVLKGTNRINWIAYAIGNHLAGAHEKAIAILDIFWTTLGDNKETTYEDSEMLLYKNLIIQETGDIKWALKHLDSIKERCLDPLYVRERRANLLHENGDAKAAEEELRYLLNINPENYDYHFALRKVLGLTPAEGEELSAEQLTKLTELYASLREQYPKCAACARLPLNFLPAGDDFKAYIDPYLVTRLRKGQPSLYRDIRDVYDDAKKASIIGDLVASYVENLKASGRFYKDGEGDTEDPSVYMWTLYYLGNHYDRMAQPQKAHEVVDAAILHSSTNIDLYVLKARIYKHAGDHLSAYSFMDKARRMDLADRYLNTKCVRYALRANQVEKAKETVKLFLRDGDTIESLYELQVCWYALAMGGSFARQKQWGPALRKYHDVDEHFSTIHEDQFDFHTYCLRKMTLRAYVGMLRFEDTLRNHRFFIKAATGAIKVYLSMYDNPVVVEDKSAEEAEKLAKMSPEDQKKYKKQQKAQADKAKLAKAEQEMKDQLDVDADKDKRAETKDPLGDAQKFVKQLKTFCPKILTTHLLGFEVFLRKKQFVLAMKCIKDARAVDAANPEVHSAVVRLLHAIESNKANANPVVQKVLDVESAEIMGGYISAGTYNADFLKNNSSSLKHRLHYAIAANAMGDGAKQAADTIVQSLDQCENITLQDAQDCYDFVGSLGLEAVTASFKKDLNKRLPYAVAFMNDEQLAVVTSRCQELDEDTKRTPEFNL